MIGFEKILEEIQYFCCFVVLWGLLVDRIIKRFYIIKISFDFYGYFFESE